MWIIPKTLSVFVPDTEGLSLELDEQARILESSAMWRSKPSSKQTWLRRLKKGGWLTHLCGRILKPSLHQSFEEKYMEFWEDIPANPSVQRASDKAKTTRDTYGHISESTSGQLDLFGAFSRTSQVTPRWGYGESCPIWKKKVTDVRLAYSARKKFLLLTKGNECSSLQGWATPQASDHVEGARTAPASNQKCLGRDLNQMENWPTPRAGNPGSRKPGTGGKILAEEAKKSWGTPQARDWKGAQGCAYKGGAKDLPAQTEGVPPHNGPPAQEKSNTPGKNHGSWPTPTSNAVTGGQTGLAGGSGTRASLEKKLGRAEAMKLNAKLNPNWVESLQGLKVGWTQLPTEWIDSDCSVTELSPKQQN